MIARPARLPPLRPQRQTRRSEHKMQTLLGSSDVAFDEIAVFFELRDRLSFSNGSKANAVGQSPSSYSFRASTHRRMADLGSRRPEYKLIHYASARPSGDCHLASRRTCGGNGRRSRIAVKRRRDERAPDGRIFATIGGVAPDENVQQALSKVQHLRAKK
jgi:hypothetical protein